jgi:lipopolysaccharide transport system ATP-binding protein
MSDVAGGGRTVLFVSHNSRAVRALCGRAILMKDGQIENEGRVADVLEAYADMSATHSLSVGDLADFVRKGEGKVRFRSIGFFDDEGDPLDKPATGNALNIALRFDGSNTERRPSRVGIAFYNIMDELLFHCACEASFSAPLQVGAGDTINCRIPRLPLTVGQYKIGLFLERDGIVEDWLQDYVTIDVADGNYFGNGPNVHPTWEGKTVLVDNEWRRLPNDIAD